MRKKFVLLCIVLVAVLSTAMLSAVLTVSAEEVTEYNITFTDTECSEYLYVWANIEGPSDFDTIPEGAEVRISFGCDNKDSDYYYYVLTGIRVNGGDFIEVNEFGNAYFTMPAEDVEIEAILEKAYSITLADTEYSMYLHVYPNREGISGLDTVPAGTEVYVEFYCSDEESEYYNYALAGIRVNGGELIQAEAYGNAWFTMPAEDVEIEAVLVFEKAYSITFTDTEYSECLYADPEKAAKGAEVLVYFWDRNNDYDYVLTGIRVNGGELIEADAHGNAWFIMPAEDVEIEAILEKAYSITFADTEYSECLYADLREATEGTEVRISFYNEDSEYYNYVLAGIRVNGGQLIESDEHGYAWFTMPAEDVEIEAVLEETYTITFADTEYSEYLYVSRSIATEGTEVSVRLWGSNNYVLTGIYINGGALIEADEYGCAYFTMPAENVVISVAVEEYREYSITDSDGEPMYAEFEYDGEWYETQSASEGMTLRIPAESNVIGVYINDEKIDANEDGYIYFTMPAEDVVVTPIYAEQYDFHIDIEESSSIVANNTNCIRIVVDGSYRYPYGTIEGTAFVGNTVTISSYVYTSIIGAYINGEKIDADESGNIEFTMPEEDVEIILISNLYSLSSSNDVDFFIAETDEFDIYAKEGQTVHVYHHYDDSMVVIGAYVNGEKVDADEEGDICFTMPAEDAEIELIFAPFYTITVDENFDIDCDVWIDFWTDNGYNCFVAGQEVELTYYKEAGWVGFTVNGEEINFTVVEEGYRYITVSFIMPDEDVLIEGIYDDTPYTITVNSDYGVFVPSSALVNEFIVIRAEHIPGYTLSMTLNGVDYDEFTGGDPDGFRMPAENLSIVITYTANDTNPEEITFEADIDALPSAGFGYDYTPDIKLSDSILAAIPEEMRDEIEIRWFASDEAFSTLTFDNYEEFFTLYQMGYNQDLSTFVDGYNHGAAFAIVTDKNYVFASDVAIINGVEVPITVLRLDIGVEEIYGTVVFFEFELAELVEKDVSLDLTVENLPSKGDSVYDSEIDFELPIDADYVVEDFLWLYSPDGEFPEINSFEDFNSLEDFMVEYDAVFVSEGKYAILLLVSVDYGTNITDGTIIFNGKIITARVITQAELEAYMMASENLVYVLVEFEVSDNGDIVPAEILGDAPSGDEDDNDQNNNQNNNQNNEENNPETGDKNHISMIISIIAAVIILGTFVIITVTKKSKCNKT